MLRRSCAGPLGLALLTVHLLGAAPVLAEPPTGAVSRSLEDLVRASDLVVVGHIDDGSVAGAPLRLVVQDVLLGRLAPGAVVTLSGADSPAASGVWLLAEGVDGAWSSLEPAPRDEGWREPILELIGRTGMRLASLRESVGVGHPVLLRLSLRNPGERPVTFRAFLHADGTLDPATLDLRVERFGPDGAVPVPGRARVARIVAGDGLTLQPGERTDLVFDLADVVELAEPGLHVVRIPAPAPWGTAEARVLIR